MAKVKYPFYSMTARGTLITQVSSPPRGRKRGLFNYRGRMAGAIVYQKNGTVTRTR